MARERGVEIPSPSTWTSAFLLSQFWLSPWGASVHLIKQYTHVLKWHTVGRDMWYAGQLRIRQWKPTQKTSGFCYTTSQAPTWTHDIADLSSEAYSTYEHFDISFGTARYRHTSKPVLEVKAVTQPESISVVKKKKLHAPTPPHAVPVLTIGILYSLVHSIKV